MFNVVVSDLQTAIRERADIVDDPFISDDELIRMIDRSWKAFYDIITSSFQTYNFSEGTPFSTIPGTAAYDLPADCYKVLGIDIQLNSVGNRWIKLKRDSFRNRNRVFGHVSYTETANQVRFTPVPKNSNTIKISYIPQPNSVSLSTDSINVITPGWEEYIINDCAYKCKVKMDYAPDDLSALQNLKSEIRDSIQLMASQRDYGEPQSVVKNNENHNLNTFNSWGVSW
jgi:hypothetical protein